MFQICNLSLCDLLEQSGDKANFASADVLSLIQDKLKNKECKRGLKIVQKTLISGEKGVVALAADITPFDLSSHIPSLCEEQGVPLVYLRSKFDILTDNQKPVSCVLIPESLLGPKEYEILRVSQMTKYLEQAK